MAIDTKPLSGVIFEIVMAIYAALVRVLPVGKLHR